MGAKRRPFRWGHQAISTSLPEAALRRAIRAYLDGASLAAATEGLPISACGLHSVLVRLGLGRSNAEAQRLRSPVSEDDRAAIVRLYKRGLSTHAIADMLDLGYGTVRRHLARAQVGLRDRREGQLQSRRSTRTRERAAQACRMVLIDGLSQVEAGRRLGVSDKTVRHYLRNHNPYAP